jgi:site-specific recombinase XerD
MARNDDMSALEEDFARYLVDVRALRQQSLTKHVRTFRRFAVYLRSRRVRSVRRVSLDLAYAFLEQCARGGARSYAKALCDSMRSILRYLHFTGMLPEDLSLHMVAPCVWKHASVPEAFTEAESERMFASLRAETPYDYRERAVVLLLLCYGLRLGEVVRLGLDDIDGRRKTISIRERKNRVPLVLPLLPGVEEALRGYLAHFRPEGLKTRRFFVTIKRRSREPLKEQAVHQIVKKFLRRCALDGCATKFRHTLATRLINNGASLEAIRGVLGHRHSDSTRVYAKVHWEALREVAQNHALSL